jgi:hypothetical protein
LKFARKYEITVKEKNQEEEIWRNGYICDSATDVGAACHDAGGIHSI